MIQVQLENYSTCPSQKSEDSPCVVVSEYSDCARDHGGQLLRGFIQRASYLEMEPKAETPLSLIARVQSKLYIVRLGVFGRL